VVVGGGGTNRRRLWRVGGVVGRRVGVVCVGRRARRQGAVGRVWQRWGRPVGNGGGELLARPVACFRATGKVAQVNKREGWQPEWCTRGGGHARRATKPYCVAGVRGMRCVGKCRTRGCCYTFAPAGEAPRQEERTTVGSMNVAACGGGENGTYKSRVQKR